MPLTAAEVASIRAECFAEDIELPEGAEHWDAANLRQFFEAGGMVTGGSTSIEHPTASSALPPPQTTAQASTPPTDPVQLDPRSPPKMPLVYALALPEGQSAGHRPPLVVILHGSGADEHDLFSLAQPLSAAAGGAVVASLRGPCVCACLPD